MSPFQGEGRRFESGPPLQNNMPRGIIQPLRTSVGSTFLLFISIVTLIGFADAIMSYATPVFLEQKFSNPFLVGLVFAFSSFMGLMFDFYGSERLKSRGLGFFLFSTVFLAIAFPSILLFFPPHILTYLLALGIWGIYYEMEAFTVFNFIESKIAKSEYAKAWGVVSNMRSLAYMAGPSLATFLVSISLNLSFYTALSIFLFVLITLMLTSKTFKSKKLSEDETGTFRTYTTKEEFKVWAILIRKVWFLWLFSFILSWTDAAFWTVGILYVEDLKAVHPLGGLFIMAYMLPGTIMGFVLPKFASKLGKKRTAFVAASIGGTLLILIALIDNMYMLLLVTFLSSMFSSLAYPAVSATYEDYVKRLGIFGNDMIGIKQTSSSIAFIVGPIFFGFIASMVGSKQMFGYAGAILAFTGLISILLVPNKIKMPQRELTTIA